MICYRIGRLALLCALLALAACGGKAASTGQGIASDRLQSSDGPQYVHLQPVSDSLRAALDREALQLAPAEILSDKTASAINSLLGPLPQHASGKAVSAAEQKTYILGKDS